MTTEPDPLPAGWTEDRVKRVASYHEGLSEDEQVNEDEEAAREHSGQAVISVPLDLLPAIRQLLSGQQNA